MEQVNSIDKKIKQQDNSMNGTYFIICEEKSSVCLKFYFLTAIIMVICNSSAKKDTLL